MLIAHNVGDSYGAKCLNAHLHSVKDFFLTNMVIAMGDLDQAGRQGLS